MGDLKAEIEAANRAFMEAFKSGDAAGVAGAYTEGGRLLPPNAEMLAGKAAIQAVWQGAMDMGAKEAKLETVEVKPMGEGAAYEIGAYTLRLEPEGAEAMTDTGKYVVLWKREGDRWKLDVDIWNTNLPT